MYDTLQTKQNFVCTMNIIDTSSERLLQKILNLQGNVLYFINPAFHNLPYVMWCVSELSLTASVVTSYFSIKVNRYL